MAEEKRIKREGIGEKEEGRRAAPRSERTEGKALALRLVYQFAESKPSYLRHEALLRSQQAAAGERCAAGAWATSQSAQCFVYLGFSQVSWNLLLAGEKEGFRSLG